MPPNMWIERNTSSLSNLAEIVIVVVVVIVVAVVTYFVVILMVVVALVVDLPLLGMVESHAHWGLSRTDL